jgi:GAF domain-containing protein
LSDSKSSPKTDSTSSAIVTLDDESLGLLNAKFEIADALLKMAPKEIKFNDLAREILLLVVRVVNCEAGSIFELDKENKSLFFRAVSGRSSDVVSKFSIPFGQGVVGHVASSKFPLVVDNTEESRMHLKSVAQTAGFEARNLIAAPIIIRGRVYGVLELLNRVGEKTFTPEDLEVATYFCEMTARLFEVRFMLAWSNQQEKQRETA